MTTVILTDNYYVEIDKNRNYTLYRKEQRTDKKTGEATTSIRNIGYFSSMENVLKIGLIKDMEAIGIEPNKLSITGYINALDAIESKLVYDFTQVMEVKLTSEEKEAIL